MAMAAEQALRLLVDRGGFTIDEAYSLASVAVDFGVTQVVDGKLGCHAAVARALLEPQADGAWLGVDGCPPVSAMV